MQMHQARLMWNQHGNSGVQTIEVGGGWNALFRLQQRGGESANGGARRPVSVSVACHAPRDCCCRHGCHLAGVLLTKTAALRFSYLHCYG